MNRQPELGITGGDNEFAVHVIRAILDGRSINGHLRRLSERW